jgi:hypothetical protein
MNAIVARLGFWFGLLALGVVAACAQGAPADPVAEIPAPVVMAEPTCGNGKPDMGEICDCMKGVTTLCTLDGKTCDMMMNGTTGPLLCNAKTCQFDISMCKPIGGGPGAGGTGK